MSKRLVGPIQGGFWSGSSGMGSCDATIAWTFGHHASLDFWDGNGNCWECGVLYNE